MRFWTGPLLTGLVLIVIKQTPVTGLTMQAHTHTRCHVEQNLLGLTGTARCV